MPSYVQNKFAVDIKDEAATLALSVLGQDPKDIEINCFEDKIEIKAKKTQEDKEHPFNQLVSDIEERINVGKNFDGRKTSLIRENFALLSKFPLPPPVLLLVVQPLSFPLCQGMLH